MAKRVYHNRRRAGSPRLDKARVLLLLGLLLIAVGVATLWVFTSSIQGTVVIAWLAFLRQNLGWASYLVPIFLVGLGLWTIRQGSKRPWRWPWLSLTGAFIILIVALALTSLLFDKPLATFQSSTGGAVGYLVGSGVRILVGQTIAVILLLVCGIAGVMLILRVPYKKLVSFVGILLVTVASLARVWELWQCSVGVGWCKSLSGNHSRVRYQPFCQPPRGRNPEMLAQ
jgi:hypothetical protein